MEGDIRRGIRVWLDHGSFDRRINVCFYEEVEGHSYAVARLGPFEKMGPHGLIPDHAIQRVDPELAQQLMNGLWECGVRPAQGQGSAGQLEATRSHLEDMRRLVFDEPEPEDRERRLREARPA